jgi:hypothetical protein
MRAALVLALVLVPLGARADEDDPKLARASAQPSPPRVAADEDDPKLARSASPRSRFHPDHQVPRFKLSYRRLTTAGLEGSPIGFNGGELDVYPASGYLRFGLSAEGGASASYSAWYSMVGAALGFQYPWRVTPFVEGRFSAGLIGATLMGQSAVSYIYVGGIDSGIELYLGGRFYLTAAAGWAHPVFRGVDVQQLLAYPTATPVLKDFAADTFTFKLGFGL